MSVGEQLGRAAQLTAALAAVCLLTTTATVWLVLHLGSASSTRAQHATAALQALQTSMLDQETGLLGWQLTRDPAFFAPYDEGQVAGDRELAQLTGLVGQHGPSLVPLETARAAWQQWAQHIRAAKGASAIGAIDRGKAAFDSYRAQEALVAQALPRLRDRRGTSAAVTYLAITADAILLAGALSLAVRRQRQLRRSLLEPVESLLDAMAKVARGERQPLPQPSGPRELAHLTQRFHEMLTALDTVTAASERDALTGLLNRGRFDHDISAACALAERHRLPVCLLLLDLDNFKALNDTHGHQTGDLALKVVGDVLRRHVRAGELAFRYGGEEFALLLVKTELAGAVEAAERIRAELAAATARAGLPQLTASVGAACRRGDAPESLLSRADRALYQAKAHGRNQVRTDEVISLPRQEHAFEAAEPPLSARATPG